MENYTKEQLLALENYFLKRGQTVSIDRSDPRLIETESSRRRLEAKSRSMKKEINLLIRRLNRRCL